MLHFLILACPQAVSTELRPEAVHDGFGEEVRVLGDVNGDGAVDIGIVDSGGRGGESALWVVSGKNFEVLHQLDWRRGGQRWLAPFDDLDGDGRDDFLVGVGRWNSGVTAISGASGQALYRVDWPGRWKRGMKVVGDVDWDGVRDLAVFHDEARSADGRSTGAILPGNSVLRLHSGATGDVLWTIEDPPLEEGHLVATRVCDAGDLDRDGLDDLARNLRGSSTLDILSGADGALLEQYPIDGDGYLVGPIDSDGDGALEVLVVGERVRLRTLAGETRWNVRRQGLFADGGPFLGSDVDADGVRDFVSVDWAEVELISGATGAVLQRSDTYPWGFNHLELRLFRDFDADGVVDFLAVHHYQGSTEGEVRVLSGADFVTLVVIERTELEPTVHPTFGTALCVLDDLDGDGVRDYAVADPEGPRFDPHGSLLVLSGADDRFLARIEGERGMVGSLTFLGDVGGDEAGEVLIGSPAPGCAPGEACLALVVDVAASLDAKHARILRGDRHAGISAQDLASVPDHDGDGVREYVARRISPAGRSFEVFSGTSGRSLGGLADGVADGLAGQAQAGTALDLDDLNGDGVPETIEGVPSGGPDADGMVHVRDGASGRLLRRVIRSRLRARD